MSPEGTCAGLAQGTYGAGEHVFEWNGQGARGSAAAGTYFLLVRAETGQLVSKVLLLQ